MDEYLLKIAVKNAVKEAIAENAELSRDEKYWYDSISKKIDSLSNPDDKKGLKLWLENFMQASSSSIRKQLAKDIEYQIHKSEKKK